MASPMTLGFKKYGSPVYGSAWGTHGVLLCGGGGQMACGLTNKVMLVTCDDVGHLSDPVLTLETGKELPSRRHAYCDESGDALLVLGNSSLAGALLQCGGATGGTRARSMALHPGGTDLICGLDEGCGHYKLNPAKEEEEDKAKGSLAVHSNATLAKVGEQKCIAFSPKGDLLALGAEDGTIRLFSWPGMTALLTKEKAHDKAITDLHFDKAGARLLSVSQEVAQADTGAKVWAVAVEGEAATLTAAATLFDASKWARAKLYGSHRGAALLSGDADAVFTGFNTRLRKGPDSYVMRWDGSMCAALTTAHKEGKITALALSPDGKVLATGSSEGEVLMYETKRLVKVAHLRNIHEVFVTTLAFAPDSTRLLSTSGDTSAHVAPVTDKPPALQSLPIFLILLMAVVAYLVQRYLQATSAGAISG